MKILVRAEEFGLGPSSRIAKITTELSKLGFVIDIVSNKFTSVIQDMSIINQSLEIEFFMKDPDRAFLGYEMILIALDWDFAALAVKNHECVTFVDGLTWFWNSIPDCFDHFKMYWAVDFKGVSQRLLSLQNRNPRLRIVPPFVRYIDCDQILERLGYILSFGGVDNPSFEVGVSKIYVTSVLEGLGKGQVFDHILGNSKLHSKIKSMPFLEFQDKLSSCKGFIGTSGLGHICDLIYLSVPALFLMPVNDSQYRQSQLLPIQNDQWNYIQWDEFGPEYVVNYNSSQDNILRKIEENINLFAEDKHAQYLLKVRIEYFMVTTINYVPPSYSVLADYWGYNGHKIIADNVMKMLSV
jgi:hypothetical protein